MKQKPLVSLCTYCYNGERFVHKYFEALIAQTWPNVEVIFYNNGSADRTGEIAEEYRQQLLAKGYIVHIYHYKENQCTCALKQLALQQMQGDYFCGCDSDDIMYPEHIEHMVNYLEEHSEKGMVFCKLRIVNEATSEVMGIMEAKEYSAADGDKAFVDCFTGKHSLYTAIGYMLRTSMIDKVIPNREIYQSRFGENYQLQLPFLYHNLQGYMDEVLGDYMVRIDSYSGQLNGEKRMNAYKGQEETILATLDSINPENKEYYALLAKQYLRRERLKTAILCNNKAWIAESRRDCEEIHAMDLNLRLRCITPIYLLLRKVFRRK